MAKDYAHTPEEVAALPEVQQACDDLVWETNERARCKAALLEFEPGPESNPETVNWEVVDYAEWAWITAKREAKEEVDLYKGLGKSTFRSAALSMKELAAEITRRTKAEVLLEWMDDNTAHTWRCHYYELEKGKPCKCGYQKDYDAWQATVPADEKEPT